jgi:hypothetical protein
VGPGPLTHSAQSACQIDHPSKQLLMRAPNADRNYVVILRSARKLGELGHRVTVGAPSTRSRSLPESTMKSSTAAAIPIG